MIRITEDISIGRDEVSFAFVRSSGPGGQNVNKVATAVQLRFDVDRSPSLPPEVKRRLRRMAGAAMTRGGELIIDARRRRSQHRNRLEAMDRLVDLIRRAAVVPKRRRKTRPTAASRKRRLAAKQRRSRVKGLRGPVCRDQ